MFDYSSANLLSWANSVAVWVPAALVILVAALGLTVAGSPPARRFTRRMWLAMIFLCGSLAVAGAVWQAQEALHRGSEAAAPPGTAAALAARVKSLQDRLARAQQPRQRRTIAPETAAGLAAYLKKSGSRQVVVSAISGDLEAYDYADQLANVLRAGGWQAGGPEITHAFGDIHAVGINLFANPAQPSDTAKILVAAFGRFNIPYEPRVTPGGTVPDSDAVELFVGALPGTEIASTGSAPRHPAADPHAPIKAAVVGQGSGNAAGTAGMQTKGNGR